MNLKPYYSVKEVAKMLGVSNSLVYKKIDESVIPARRMGARKLIPVTYVREILEIEGEN